MTKNTKLVLTNGDLDGMTGDDRWLGFGYLGGRRNALAEGQAADVVAADAKVLEWANGHGWTRENLFAWANSKAGRWAADQALWNEAADWGLVVAQGLMAKVSR